jgi:hypothetical protein
MLKKLPLIITGILLIYSCTSNRKENTKEISHKEIEIKSEQADTSVLNDMINEVKCIKLESSPKSMFGNIDKLIFNDKYFFTLDTDNTKGVFIFDTTGKFINAIKNPGKGPGEYLSLVDMAITDDNTIYIVDNIGKKIIQYNIDGICTNVIKLKKEYPLNIHVNKNKLYVYNYLINFKDNTKDFKITQYNRKLKK